MEIRQTGLAGCMLIVPDRHGDQRGFFSETFRQSWLEELGIDLSFIQDNEAVSRVRGTLRGLHFQTGFSAQAKLVRCVAGEIYDVAVDLRQGSPSYGRHVGVTLSAENGHQLFVPRGFAHGYLTLGDQAHVVYKTDNYYDPDRDKAISSHDATLGIEWPIAASDVVRSEKDSQAPVLADLPSFFTYDPNAPYGTKVSGIE